MFRIKKLVLMALALSLSATAFSQTKDSLAQKVTAYAADKFPIARAFNLEYSMVTPFKYSSTYLGSDLPEGKVENLQQVRVSSTINFIKKKKWTLGTTLTYRYISTETNSANLQNGTIENRKEDFHYHSQSINFSYFSKLFGKTAIYSGSVITDGSQESFERIKGLVSATLVLKATRETQMTLGFVAFVDPSAVFPVFPSFTYKHQFTNGWTADVILPMGAFMRKNIASNGRLSIGSELANTYFYLYDLDNTGKTYAMNQMEINSGLTYEHHLGKSFIASFKTGVKNVPNSRIFERGKSQNDYIFKASPEASFYFNAGISFNPFGKAKK